MQIEAGKYYRTRDGRKAGPLVGPDWSGLFRDDSIKQRTDTPNAPQWWEQDGSVSDEREGEEGDTLVAEWSEGPVRTETVTTRRIVPGVYGRLEVRGWDDDCVTLLLASRGGAIERGFVHLLNATELDELAMVASQLAEALRDQP